MTSMRIQLRSASCAHSHSFCTHIVHATASNSCTMCCVTQLGPVHAARPAAVVIACLAHSRVLGELLGVALHGCL